MHHRWLDIRSSRRQLAPCAAMVCALLLPGALTARQQGAKVAPGLTPTDPQFGLSQALDEALRTGWQLYMKHQDGAALEKLQQALSLAREEKNTWAEGEAHRILGLIALRAAKYPEAGAELNEALVFFESVDAPPSIALTHGHLAAVKNYMGKPAEALELYRKALSEFEELHDLAGQARILENLLYVDAVPASEKASYRERGLQLARELGNKSLEAKFLHRTGDALFSAGDFAGAIEKLKEASACAEQANDQAELSYILTSLGRLYRMHGAYDDAIASYEKGLAIQQELGDKFGVIQSLNAMAISYGLAGRSREAMDHYERGLSLARETRSPKVIAFMTGNLGGACNGNGDYKRAIELLQESLRLDPSSPYLGSRYIQLSAAYRGIGEYQQALESANQAVLLTRQGSDLTMLYEALRARTALYRSLERFPEALADTDAAIEVVERIRAKLIPADYFKQGYAAVTQSLFEDAIQLEERLGQHQQAMLAAEQARARAFLDLLASRTGEQGSSEQAGPAAPDSPTKSPSVMATSSGETRTSAGTVELATRGSNSFKLEDPRGVRELASPASASPPTFEGLVATAKRLDSTLLSYWIGPDATFVWTLNPKGALHESRIAVTSEQLTKLIGATSYREQEKRQTEVSAEAAPRASGLTVAPTVSPTSRGPQTLSLRGGGELVLLGQTSSSWRELYKLLILPVQDFLPARGSRLTIVPQGPLFHLSFAALQDANGRYLVEDYALNYAPSLGVLGLTGQRKQQLGQRNPRYLIVADPTISPELSQAKKLPALPGARKEALSLARLLPKADTQVLMGSAASKEALREQLAGRTVLHLATHAIVRDDQPMDSFFVLSSGENSAPASGRLTVQEIYAMNLQTDLVMLSACSTALGKLSGDGMAGLTRAFFYGGTPSVVATLWDVADEPTSQLVSDFYSALQKDPDKSRALRAAQLHLMRALRAGQVHVNTSLGRMTLPEDPVFWAGFVLQGEP